MSKITLSDFDGIALGEKIRSKELGCEEVLNQTIENIDAVNPALNAVIHPMYDEAKNLAQQWQKRVDSGDANDSVFCGVPFVLKDLLAEYKGAPFNEGCVALKDYVSKVDSELVVRQKASGVVICAKTNTPEFGGSPVTEPELHGVTRNPWNTEHTPGGSSGGSAALVAAGVVPMGHANDGGGSIRIPASCCGLFGLKPSRGRNPLGPLFGDLGGGIIYEHVVSRSVRDSAAMLDATAGKTPGDPYQAPPLANSFLDECQRDPGKLRIGYLNQLPPGWHQTTSPHADCVNAVEATAKLCASLGHDVELADPSAFAHPDVPAVFGPHFSAFVGFVVRYWEREIGRPFERGDMEDATWDWYQASLATNSADFLVAVEAAQLLTRQIANWYEAGNYDLLLTPTLSVPPVKIGAFEPDASKPGQWLIDILSFVAFTYVYNLTGQPAATVPLQWNEQDLPLGSQFIGRYGEEATLFRLAAQLEQAQPWLDRKPRVHCDYGS
ncbi:MAG: amidase [Pseudomonadota bacterium]